MATTWWGELVDLVWPRTCAGCAEPGSVLCAACRGGASIAVIDELTAGPAGLPVYAAGAYQQGLRRALIAYKERGRHELAVPLGQLLRSAVDLLLANHGPGRPGTPFRPPDWRAVRLVPVPSSPRAARARGGDHMLRLARAATRGRGVAPAAVLTTRGERADAAGLGIRERLHGGAGRYRATGPYRPVRAAVLLDDIVTTGATARDAAAALQRAGWSVLGVAVVAATPRRPVVLPPPVRAGRSHGTGQVAGVGAPINGCGNASPL